MPFLDQSYMHGVMNTDNFSSIDRQGRCYAYGNQPHIAHWKICWI